MHDAGADLLVVGSGIFAREDLPQAYGRLGTSRWHESASGRSSSPSAAQGRAYPKPTVGAVVVAGGEVVGEGATEAGGPARRGRRARRPPASARAARRST